MNENEILKTAMLDLMKCVEICRMALNRGHLSVEEDNQIGVTVQALRDTFASIEPPTE